MPGLLDNLLASLALSNMQQPQPGNTYSPTGAEGMPDMSATDPFANAPAPAAPKPGAQSFGPFAGLLNAPAGTPYSQPVAGSDQPPATNDVQAQEPQVFKDGVPLPKPRPDTGLNGRDEVPAGAPLSLAPPMPSDSAKLPPGAAPTGPASPSAGQPPPSSGGIGSLLGNVANKIFDPNHAATWMALASGFAGAPSLGMGIGRAAGAAVPAIAADRANELRMSAISQTYQAVRSQLIAQGKSPQEAGMTAIAAAQNPELLKMLAPKLYNALPPTVHTQTGMMGEQTLRVFDPNSGTFKDQNGQTGAVTGGVPATPESEQIFNNIVQARTQGANQDQLLQQVPVQLRDYVKSMLKGDAIPTNLPMRGNARTNALTLAHAIDPSFNENLIPMRQTFAKSMGSMQAASFGGQVKSAGTVMHHLDDALSQLPVLESGITGASEMLPALNPLKAGLRGQIGDKQYNDAIGHYKGAISGIGNELEYLLKGGVGTEKSTQDIIGRLDITKNAPSTVRGALDEVRSLMMGRLSNVAQAKDRAFGSDTDPLTLLGPQERAVAERLQAGTYAGQQRAAAGGAAPAATAPVPRAAPPPGNYVYNPATRTLVPAQ